MVVQNPNAVSQAKYVDDLKKRRFKFGLTVGEAFVRGIRDIGYKSTGTALDELIDNAYQAGAENVHVVFGYEGTSSTKKPAEIAVIDNGHGMIPDMIRAAVTWGGTHRENDRSGFGRYGYGLPSSCIGTGRRYTVYSRPDIGDFWAVTIDLDEISDGKCTTEEGDILVPEPVKSSPPRFVIEHLKKHYPNGAEACRTVIIIEELDKITWKTAGSLQENLLRHFGVFYHRMRATLDIWVNDKRVEPIDPLFVTAGHRWFDLDEDRAMALDPIMINVKNQETKEVEGRITVRFAYLPVTFASKDKSRGAVGKNANERFSVMKDYNGIMFSRMGRVIDLVSKIDNEHYQTTIQNNDRYCKIEVDFSAMLDEEFNVTTSKQQIVPSLRIWAVLKEAGVFKALEQMRFKYKQDRAALKDEGEKKPQGKRASEAAMEQTAQMESSPSAEQSAQREAIGKKGLDQEVVRRSRSTGKPVEEVRKELELELQGRLYKVAFESMPGAPFFRIEAFGGTKILFINKAHRFFSEVHSGPNSSPDVRAALEILLFAIGDRVLDATDQLQSIYSHETIEWSKKLDYALGQLASGAGHVEDQDDDGAGERLQAAE